MKKILLVVLSLILCGVSLYKLNELILVKDLDRMKAHMLMISPIVSNTCRTWARENNWPTWLCGPTSFAVARHMNHEFFNDKLSVTASHTEEDHIELIFGAVYVPIGDGGYRCGDHCWIQIYWKDLIIFVDPTYSQLDNLDKIVFAWFYDNQDGWVEMERFKDILRLTDNQTSILKDISCPEEYTRDRLKAIDLINRKEAPKDWYDWSLRVNGDIYHIIDNQPQ